MNKIEWISVKEKLPKMGVWVLAYCAIHGLYIGCNKRIPGANWGEWDNGNERGVLPPTHWMSLPEAPTIKDERI